MCGGGIDDTIETESISMLLPSMVIVGVPSVVESDKFPATEVAPLSLSELTRTPESALQLPRSPGIRPSPWCPERRPPELGVSAPPFRLCLGRDARDSWSDKQPPEAIWRLACKRNLWKVNGGTFVEENIFYMPWCAIFPTILYHSRIIYCSVAKTYCTSQMVILLNILIWQRFNFFSLLGCQSEYKI